MKFSIFFDLCSSLFLYTIYCRGSLFWLVFAVLQSRSRHCFFVRLRLHGYSYKKCRTLSMTIFPERFSKTLKSLQIFTLVLPNGPCFLILTPWCEPLTILHKYISRKKSCTILITFRCFPPSSRLQDLVIRR